MNWKYEINKILSAKVYIDEFLNKVSDEIILYGAGNMGIMALDFLEKNSIKPKYIIDKKFQGKLRNIDVISPINILDQDLYNTTFIICIVTTEINPIYKYLELCGCKDVRHFYNYTEIALKDKLTNGWTFFNPTKNDIKNIFEVCEALNHDKHSLAHYLQFLWWRVRRTEYIYQDYQVLSNNKYFDAPCIPTLSKNENFLDAGAHHGTTINHFLNATNKNFNNIWAFEPDEKNLDILKTTIDESLKAKINIFDIALSNIEDNLKFEDNLGFASKIKLDGSKEVIVKRIDSLKLNPSIIKLHIEGYELQALEGAIQTITNHRPIIMVLADHNDDGLYKIANFLINLKSYKLYFYLHDYCGNSAIFYAIPKERIS